MYFAISASTTGRYSDPFFSIRSTSSCPLDYKLSLRLSLLPLSSKSAVAQYILSPIYECITVGFSLRGGKEGWKRRACQLFPFPLSFHWADYVSLPSSSPCFSSVQQTSQPQRPSTYGIPFWSVLRSVVWWLENVVCWKSDSDGNISKRRFRSLPSSFIPSISRVRSMFSLSSATVACVNTHIPPASRNPRLSLWLCAASFFVCNKRHYAYDFLATLRLWPFIFCREIYNPCIMMKFQARVVIDRFRRLR